MAFQKTDEGRRAIQQRHVRLSPCQRAVLITANGTQSYRALCTLATGMGGSAADVDQLLRLGLIGEVVHGVALQPSQSVKATGSASIPISMESLWPSELSDMGALGESESQNADHHAQGQANVQADWSEAQAVVEAPEASAGVDIANAKAFTLQLLLPMGLRTMQLRRSVESVQTAEQLLQLEPLVRELLSKDQQAQLDSAYFGLVG